MSSLILRDILATESLVHLMLVVFLELTVIVVLVALFSLHQDVQAVNVAIGDMEELGSSLITLNFDFIATNCDRFTNILEKLAASSSLTNS